MRVFPMGLFLLFVDSYKSVYSLFEGAGELEELLFGVILRKAYADRAIRFMGRKSESEKR